MSQRLIMTYLLHFSLTMKYGILRLIVILWILLVLPWRSSAVLEDILEYIFPLQLQVTAHDLSAIANVIAYPLVFWFNSLKKIRFGDELLVLQGTCCWCFRSNLWISKSSELLLISHRFSLHVLGAPSHLPKKLVLKITNLERNKCIKGMITCIHFKLVSILL